MEYSLYGTWCGRVDVFRNRISNTGASSFLFFSHPLVQMNPSLISSLLFSCTIHLFTSIYLCMQFLFSLSIFFNIVRQRFLIWGSIWDVRHELMISAEQGPVSKCCPICVCVCVCVSSFKYASPLCTQAKAVNPSHPDIGSWICRIREKVEQSTEMSENSFSVNKSRWLKVNLYLDNTEDLKEGIYFPWLFWVLQTVVHLIWREDKGMLP